MDDKTEKPSIRLFQHTNQNIIEEFGKWGTNKMTNFIQIIYNQVEITDVTKSSIINKKLANQIANVATQACTASRAELRCDLGASAPKKN